MITKPNVKINLGLNVLRKREDGFHDLETLFVPYLFAKYDSSALAPRQGSAKPEGVFGVEAQDSDAPKLVQGISEDGKLMITIARAEGVDWDPLKDLTAKAYFILAQDFDLPPAKIFLEKTSPVGAGLGGGSADAAFALKMLNELCGLELSEETLAGYAARLGSDCAFFIYNRPMIGEGRGEVLTEPEGLFGHLRLDWGQDLASGAGDVACEADGKGDICGGQMYEIQVITPAGIAVSTKDAYGGIRPHLPVVPLRDALAMPVEQWDGVLVNDFEETVFAKFPELAAIKRSLYDSGAVYASMSGSGSALFAIYSK